MGAGGMTTVWRPRVRIPVPEVDDEVEVGVEVPEEELLTKKGTKRKRAPCTKGPCEHGVKYRSRCKVCSRLSARSSALMSARSAVGHKSASTVVGALSARSAVVHQSASTVVERSSARSAVGHQSASTVVSALDARSAVVHQYASTVVERSECKECGGASICEHGRRRTRVQGVRWVHQSASTVVSALSARSAVGAQSASTVVSA